MAFLFASPRLDPVVLGVLVQLVGVEGTVVYAVLTFSASILIGALIGFRRTFTTNTRPAPARPLGTSKVGAPLTVAFRFTGW